jgi:hypothetical protein
MPPTAVGCAGSDDDTVMKGAVIGAGIGRAHRQGENIYGVCFVRLDIFNRAFLTNCVLLLAGSVCFRVSGIGISRWN